MEGSEKMGIIIALLITGIIVSGAMAIKTGKEEREMEQGWIEQEGEKFIIAMQEEKARRVEKSTEDAS